MGVQGMQDVEDDFIWQENCRLCLDGISGSLHLIGKVCLERKSSFCGSRRFPPYFHAQRPFRIQYNAVYVTTLEMTMKNPPFEGLSAGSVSVTVLITLTGALCRCSFALEISSGLPGYRM